jgi:hypothetical protein
LRSLQDQIARLRIQLNDEKQRLKQRDADIKAFVLVQDLFLAEQEAPKLVPANWLSAYRVLQAHASSDAGDGAEPHVGEERRENKPNPATPHLVEGDFQSDKYPTCPRGKVPLSTKDPMAQDLLWKYAQRRRAVDAEFAADLETALRAKGFQPESDATNAGFGAEPYVTDARDETDVGEQCDMCDERWTHSFRGCSKHFNQVIVSLADDEALAFCSHRTPNASSSITERPPLTHVAVRWNDKVWALPAPARHHHILRAIKMVTGKDVDSLPSYPTEDDQGFLDASGRYLTRPQALVSAELNNQIRNGKIIGSVLTSEDLW